MQTHLTERALLGACLLSDKAREYALQHLSHEHFVALTNKTIFSALQALSDQPVDEIILVNYLTEQQRLDDAGGSTLVLSLASHCPSVATYKRYCDQIVSDYARRSTLEAAQKITEAADKATEIDSILDDADEMLARIRSTVSVAKGNLGQSMSDLQETYENTVITQGLPLPFSDLNAINRGQHPGNVIITGGYSADGKTWWGMQCVEEVASLGHKTGVDTLEMPSSELYQRFLCQYPGVKLKDIYNRVDTQPIIERKRQLSKMNIRMFDSGDGMTSMKAIEREIMRAYAEGDPYKYFLIDHMHLMEHEGSDLRIGLGKTMAHAKRIAVKYGLVIHFLAQLRRSTDKSKTRFPRPTMADLREASQIENIADLIMMVWRDRDDDQQPLNTGLLIPAKVRSGRMISPIHITWREDICRFTQPPAIARWEPVTTAY